MALPSTGPLALSLNIRAEESIKNSSLPTTDVSTRQISESAGFAEPDAFSEFYGYSSAVLPTMASIRVSGGPNDSYIAFAATPATNGFVAITSRGFYFGTDYRGPQYNTRYQVDTSNSLGEFSRGFGGLSASVTYYCWGYVQNQIGEAYTARGAAATLPAIALSGYGQSYSGNWGLDIYGEDWTGTEMYGWGNRGIGQYYLHPYYGWVSIGELNGGLQVKGHHPINKYYGELFQRANNAPTQMRKRYWSSCWNEIYQWGNTVTYKTPDYSNCNYYYTGNNGSSSQGGSGSGHYIREGYGSWSPMTYYHGGWYNPYQIYWPSRSVETYSQINIEESWEWNGYAYTN
jgi:hypothetical protein